MLKILAQFIISGSIVVGASYAAPHFGQRWAGLLVAAPLLTLLTFVFLAANPSNGNLHNYLLAALIFMIPAAIFIACLLLLSGHLHFILNIVCSAMVYALAVLTLTKLLPTLK